MEILAALLTAVTYWLFLFYFLKGRRERLGERAAALLCEKQRCRRRWYWNVALAIFVPLLVFGRIGMAIYFWLRWRDNDLLHSIFELNSLFFVRNLIATIVWTPFLFLLLPISLEFRQRAMLVYQGMFSILIPWKRVKYCKRLPVSGRLQLRTRGMKYEVDGSNVDAASLLAALTTVVEVRDCAGTLLHPELQAQREEQAGANAPPPWRFQFDLRTLLLFVLFASAAMSWYGIRYHRDEAEQTALARLDPFKPDVFGPPFMLWIDFSKSSVKPHDGDLALLSAFDRLEGLDLTGAPITDAGLTHLGPLRSLRTLNLSKTAVTDQGLRNWNDCRS